jgi:hypothetical protein
MHKTYILLDSFQIIYISENDKHWHKFIFQVFEICLIFLCYWLSPAQSFLGPSPFGLVTIFYCLRCESSLFVASYDSQGRGGGIRTRLHTDVNWSWL